ncbi:hypothetical protein QQS21_009282 [Conoideocrella luteorostrata]|uniref:P-loop containing nucleoside triphosphate hydrolase protein n=1 Tax=Conoideocrella luteorostrata TaxID=1105319 RepID=A0AAJ0CJK9_9HYPO|nr:hypothetical protein QQS21_009282 [Conoideocrella luteorostrata]
MAMSDSKTIPILFTCTVVLKAAMFILESIEKQHILVDNHRDASKEMTSSTISRSSFFWLTPLFRTGYRRNLELKDLDRLDPKLESDHLYKALAVELENGMYIAARGETGAPGALFKAWLRVFPWPAIAPALPKIFQIGFTYTQPFLITQGITLAAMPERQPYNNIGYGLIGAYAIVYTGIAVSTGQYDWMTFRTSTIMRGSVIGLIYQKALRLDLHSEDVSPDGALTLMSTDTETVMHCVHQIHEVWAAMLEIAIGIYLIYRQLGAACAMPVAVSFAVLVLMSFLAVYIGKAQAAWIQASQDRVTTTSKTLGSIKWLKMSGLNDVAFAMIRKLRAHELKVSEKFRMLTGASLMLFICVPIWGPILTFIVYGIVASKGGAASLTFERMFTSYSLFTLVTNPLISIIMALPTLASALTSFGRIQKFLNGKERNDVRVNTLKLDEKPKHFEEIQLEEEPNHQYVADNADVGTITSLQGCFSWSEDAEPAINITNQWNVYRREFTLVLGPIGCGKSTLLKALLGELSSFRGEICANYSGVSYCDQTPWLPNETVRSIILGPGRLDHPWYRAVVKACALDTDMETWPSGDGTVVGTKGISMSGGQKHRLAIARALYSRSELIVFDDVFSGLDAATEDVVFHNLFGKEGLLRTSSMSAIVAASDSVLARRAAYADRILLLDENGTVKRVGTPEEVEATLGGLGPAENADQAGRNPDEKTTLVANEAARQADTVVKMMETEVDSTRRLGNVAMYGFYARAAGWDTLVIFAIAMAVFAFCGSFPSIWLKWWAADNLAVPNQHLGKWLGGYVGFGIGATVMILVATWQLFIVIINRAGAYFHDALLRTTSRAPMSFHSTVDSGTTVNRFSQDLQLIDMELPTTALGVAVGVSFGVAEFVMISISSKYMAVVLPFLILAFYPIQHVYLRTSRQMRLLDIEHKAPLFSQLISTLDGLATIRACGWQGALEEKNTAKLDQSQRPSYLLYCLQRWLTFTIDMAIAAIALMVIVITTTLREQIGPGNMGVALSSVLGFSGTLKTTVTSWVMLEISLGAVARVRNFIADTEPEDGDVHDDSDDADADADDDDDRNTAMDDWPSQGAIEMKNVTASYFTSEAVLRDISLSIQAGQRVAICGRTGSGKSSLALALLRMIAQPAGTITIDGIDISTVPHQTVRSRVVALPQEPYIFDASVRINLDPGETVSDAKMIDALQRVQLWAKLEQRGGLDALMHGKFLSQGEMQLFVFARAMLRSGRVLVLDEFSSNLDDATSEIVYEVLRTWFQGWTVIAIAHKLQWVVDFDRVAVLDAGRLVEYDEPKRLLMRDSRFKKLYNMSGHDGLSGNRGGMKG